MNKLTVLNGRITRGDLRNVMDSMDVGDFLTVTNALTARNTLNRVHHWFDEGVFTATVSRHGDLNYLFVERTA